MFRSTEVELEAGDERYLRCNLKAVPDYALEVIEEALLDPTPKAVYTVCPPGGLSNYMSAITERFTHIQCSKKKEPSVVP